MRLPLSKTRFRRIITEFVKTVNEAIDAGYTLEFYDDNHARVTTSTDTCHCTYIRELQALFDLYGINFWFTALDGHIEITIYRVQ